MKNDKDLNLYGCRAERQSYSIMMLLTSRSWARPSVPCSQRERTSILCGWGGWPQNLPLKFVSAPNFATKSTGKKYPKFCLSDMTLKMSHFLPLVVPDLSMFFLLFGDLTPNFASKLEARSKPLDLLTWKYLPRTYDSCLPSHLVA